MKRGDVFLADLEPVQGSKTHKVRLVVLVGNNASLAAASRHRCGVVTVVPLTTNLVIRGAMHVVVAATPLNGLPQDSKVQAEQVRSIDVNRINDQLGRLGVRDAAAVEGALRYHFAL